MLALVQHRRYRLSEKPAVFPVLDVNNVATKLSFDGNTTPLLLHVPRQFHFLGRSSLGPRLIWHTSPVAERLWKSLSSSDLSQLERKLVRRPPDVLGLRWAFIVAIQPAAFPSFYSVCAWLVPQGGCAIKGVCSWFLSSLVLVASCVCVNHQVKARNGASPLAFASLPSSRPCCKVGPYWLR